jgi:hypothetical protein
MRGFGAFAICFTLLFIVWYTQYKFFRRYGLQDVITIVLNGALLFVVLFYVYPLKFLFTALVERIFFGHNEVRLPNGNVVAMIEADQMGTLMLVFGAGYFAVFLVFVLLYLHAYRQRHKLQLSKLEIFDTRASIQENGLNSGIALLSMALVVFGGARYVGLSGVVYMLTGVVLAVHGVFMGRRRGKMVKADLTEV